MSVRRFRIEGVKRNRKGGAVFSNNFLTLPNTPSSSVAPISIPFTSIPLAPAGASSAPDAYDTRRNVGNSTAAVSHIPSVNYPPPPPPPLNGVSDEVGDLDASEVTPPVRPAARPSFLGTEVPSDGNTELTGTTPLDNAGFDAPDSSVELSGQDSYLKEHVEPVTQGRMPAAFLTEILKGRDYLKHVTDEAKQQAKYIEPKTGIPLLMEEIRKGIQLRPVGSTAVNPADDEVVGDVGDVLDETPPPLPPRTPSPPPPPLPPRPPKKRSKPMPKPEALLREIERGFQLKPVRNRPKPKQSKKEKKSKKALNDLLLEALQNKFKNAITSDDDDDGGEIDF